MLGHKKGQDVKEHTDILISQLKSYRFKEFEKIFKSYKTVFILFSFETKSFM